MNASILIVEDNPDNTKLLEWLLEDENYAVTSVGAAEEAFTALDQQSFDFVLMDISLPGMDGKEATRRLRAQPKYAELPIIAVTAHAIRGEDEVILASGITALVTKPIDEERLLKTIEALLRKEETHA